MTTNPPRISLHPEQLRRLAPALIHPDFVKRAICSKSFYHFVIEFWDVYNEDPFVDNWHIKYLCDECQKVVDRVIQGKPKEYDLIINVPPGTSKSTIVSRMLPAWAWQREMVTKKYVKGEKGAYIGNIKVTGRKLKFITGSHAADLALELADDTRDIINSDKYRAWFPTIKLRQDRNNKSNYSLESGGGRRSVGSKGTITGFHAHIIVIDDPIDPKRADAVSGIERKEINDWLDKTLSTRKVDKALTPTILVMQRLHEDDPTGHWLEKAKSGRKIRHICLPGEIVEKARVPVSPPEVVQYYVDGLLDPNRMGKEVLKEMLATLNQYGYAGQVLQDPAPPEGGMFKPDNIGIIDHIPSRVMKWVRYWDKAGTKDGGAYTVGVKMGVMDDGRYIITSIARDQLEANEREKLIKDMAIQDGPECLVYVEQEPGSSGKDAAMFTIKNLAGYVVYKDPVTGDKETRARPYSSQVNSGNVLMLKAVWNKDYKEELRLFPNSKYKDQVDASAGAFSKLALGMSAGTW